MPPKKDKLAANQPNKDATGKKPRKKYKTRKKKDDCPSRARKTDRVVINKQARDIIAKVYEFMKQEASSEYAEKLTNARWRCAHACGVSEKTVTRILKEKRKAQAASAAGETGAVLEAAAIGNAGETVNALTRGSLSGVLSNVNKAVSNMVSGDLQGINLIGKGATVPGVVGHLAGTAGNSTTNYPGSMGHTLDTILDGKVAAVKDIGNTVNNVVAGNYNQAVGNMSNNTGEIISHDIQGLNVITNSSDSFLFKQSVFNF